MSPPSPAPSRSAPARRLRRAGGRVLLALLALFVGLGLAELVLRPVTGLDPRPGAHERLFRFDPRLGWTFVPGARETVAFPGEYRTEVRIDERGYRELGHDGPEADALRLAVLGDSFTSNLGVDAERVFTRGIESALERETASAVEVRNLGVNGYSQVQQWLLLRRELRAADLGLVLVLLYPRNDLDENAARYWTARYDRPRAWLDSTGTLRVDTDLRRHDPPRRSWPRRLWEDLRLRAAARELWYRLRPDRVPLHRRPPELRWCRDPWAPREREAFALSVALLDSMDRTAARADVRLGVVVAPSLWQVLDAPWEQLVRRGDVPPEALDRDRPQRELERALSARGIPFLDLLPALRRAADRGRRLYYPSEQHWTADAQPVVAEAITGWLLEEGLVTAPDRVPRGSAPGP